MDAGRDRREGRSPRLRPDDEGSACARERGLRQGGRRGAGPAHPQHVHAQKQVTRKEVRRVSVAPSGRGSATLSRARLGRKAFARYSTTAGAFAVSASSLAISAPSAEKKSAPRRRPFWS